MNDDYVPCWKLEQMNDDDANDFFGKRPRFKGIGEYLENKDIDPEKQLHLDLGDFDRKSKITEPCLSEFELIVL